MIDEERDRSLRAELQSLDAGLTSIEAALPTANRRYSAYSNKSTHDYLIEERAKTRGRIQLIRRHFKYPPVKDWDEYLKTIYGSR